MAAGPPGAGPQEQVCCVPTAPVRKRGHTAWCLRAMPGSQRLGPTRTHPALGWPLRRRSRPDLKAGPFSGMPALCPILLLCSVQGHLHPYPVYPSRALSLGQGAPPL